MKKSIFLTIIFLLVFLCGMPQKSKAQIVEVGAFAGMSYYIGDINPGGHFRQPNMNFGAVVRYYDNLRWAFRLQYSHLNLKADDATIGFRPERDLNFTSKVNDFAFLAEFNFFNYWTGSNRDYITPYIFAGISVFNFNPCAYDGMELSPLNTEGNFQMNDKGEYMLDNDGDKIPDYYDLYSVSIPFGVGLKYSMTSRLGMTLEWRMHKTFTDYIDDVSGLYPETSAVVEGVDYTDPSDSYKPGMQRGNGAGKKWREFGYNNDWFGTLEFSIVYRFNLPRREICHSGIKI